MVETVAFYDKEAADVISPTRYNYNEPDIQDQKTSPLTGRTRVFSQALRFGVVGVVNTLVDVLILNILLWLFPTTSTFKLLAYNSLAYSLGAVNSYLLNKYWTFGQKQPTTRGELARFTLVTLSGIAWSTIILWIASLALHSLLVNATLWANASKLLAIVGTALISYVGMRLWVFVSKNSKKQAAHHSAVSAPENVRATHRTFQALITEPARKREEYDMGEQADKKDGSFCLSVVLPAYNEEQVIANTICDVLAVLNEWRLDFEVLVVNDGSTDQTGAIVAALARSHNRLRIVTHSTNQGYGAALASGFAAATKDHTLFMDSDGQFDIRDLQRFFPYINEYDAVIGYRLLRQDSWMRKLNAWGWKQLIGWVLGVRVRDVDCAFKLLRTSFLHRYPLETHGAMINAELLYKMKREGCTYREVAVHHLPRRGGRATGASLHVIARAFQELFISAHSWRRESQDCSAQKNGTRQHHISSSVSDKTVSDKYVSDKYVSERNTFQ